MSKVVIVMHLYTGKDGIEYPSVTTIIHILGSDALMKWANFMGLKHKKYETIMEETSEFGTLVHSNLQYLVDPKEDLIPIPPKDAIQAYDLNETLRKFQTFLKGITYETLWTEKTMVSDKLRYGGTSDWSVIINGKKTLADFKTAKKPQLHMFLQLGGYYNLSLEYGDIGYEQAAIITVNPKGTRAYVIDLESLKAYADAFQSLADFYHKYTKFSLEYGSL